ncbi:murein DD-endopeptidase MepM/ murein hydrolase activator NlpD [Angulomicrobium tetraedrale]|uniref:Murein DD-endopeptidase MepM/ murein hydrolase activator NlpD n=1 Tax=Ancylobacter tetraedralis TaxID=217068 RepID=A0A839Z7D5_9HYPH|nr:M23 family metallopeptidase [Ancylobacter tetraedralis]MBB3771033.1 murein DD-endopeptidase MepM/ murein hydrolase activator NlpD [Ancylobacter tetraedralis]
MRQNRGAGFDLGEEPPLGVDGDAEEPTNRRRISIRWLMATLLTGICGAALMGGAVYAALDGEYRFAQSPETVRSALRGALAAGERPSNVARKGDRMSILSESFAAKQTLRLASASKDGDKEVIKVRAVTKVAANLAQSVTAASVDVPRFNPAKLIADSTNDDGEAPQAEPTGDLTLVVRDIAAVPPSTKFAAELPMEDVLMKVREAAEFSTPTDTRTPALANLGIAGTLAFAPPPAGGAAASALQQPENVSSMGKSGEEATGGNDWAERAVVTKKGDTIASILVDLGVPQVSARAAAAAFLTRDLQGPLPDGMRLKVLLDGSSGSPVAVRVAVFNDTGHQGTVALSDMGKFLPVQEPADTQVADIAPDDGDDDADGGGRGGVTLYESIWETALRHDVPRPVIESLIRVYSFDVDFQRRVRTGDSFEVVYEPDEAGGAGGVLYAGLIVGGEERRYFRYQTPDDGLIDFYDESGKSAKKFLVRKPLSGGVLRSGFGMRRHPILGYSRLHSGVDWADRVGTPIYAAGNGVIKKAAWTSGYGRRIEIQHSNGYVTTYSHQSGFAKGIREGLRVRQGQLIGYIGSTGLSTGAHLHYEVLVNGRFVDPMRIRLPRGRALDGRILASFEQERERIDTLLNHSAMPKVAAGGLRALDDDTN